MPAVTRPLEGRFWAKVEKIPFHTCWEWTASLNDMGYGRFMIGSGASKKCVSAHRLAYELLVGPIPSGLSLDHLCRNPSCVNPSHLEPVTHRENVLRGVSVGAKNATKTHCPNGHPYNDRNTYLRAKRNQRECRVCHAAIELARKARLRPLMNGGAGPLTRAECSARAVAGRQSIRAARRAAGLAFVASNGGPR